MDVQSYHSGKLQGFREVKMIRKPTSVQEIYRLFKSSVPVALWMDSREENHCFMCSEPSMVGSPNEYTFKFDWFVSNQAKSDEFEGADRLSLPLFLHIFSETLQGACECLDCLSDLSVWSGSKVELRPSNDADDDDCLFPPELLKKFVVQNQKGKCHFQFMTFTPAQCKALAMSGTKTHLIFSGCRFQDQGEAFAEAYFINDQQHSSGPAKLDFEFEMPLHESRLLACCLPKLQELSLDCNVSISSELGQALVSAPLNHLKLISGNIRLSDDAQEILLCNIRQGRGPKGISIHPKAFSSRKKFERFCNALSLHHHPPNGHYLKTLGICHAGSGFSVLDPKVETALLAALRANLALTSFSLTRFCITDAYWNSLLNQVSQQPSLRKLHFELRSSNGTWPASKRKERAERLAQVILAHQHLEQVNFCCYGYDKKLWRIRVRPALQQNEHRERLEKITVSHSRKALLAEALQKLNKRPALLFTLLHQNLDVSFGSAPDSAFGLQVAN